MMRKLFTLQIDLPQKPLKQVFDFVQKNMFAIILIALAASSIYHFVFFYENGLGLAYNDARSHLDIGRRVVEGLKPGLAQLGSVWLPLPHLLMIPTIWNDFMWHSGLSGAIQSMISYVAIGLLIYIFLQRIGVGILGRLVGVFIFATNLNILYLQSTAMTELLLMSTTMAGSYFLLQWFQKEKIVDLVKSAFWIMLSSLVRYDGWFLFVVAAALVTLWVLKKHGYKKAEGIFFLFCTLGSLGIIAWFMWNALIFKDPLYFAFGQYSAHSQQSQLAAAGVLATEGNVFLSAKIYLYALLFNSNGFIALVAGIGALVMYFDKKLSSAVRIASLSLLAPLIFNILALYLGHSVLFVQGISGNTWFNVRYGIMLMPSIAIFIGYLIDRVHSLRAPLIGAFLLVTLIAFSSYDAVTIDDGRVGSSQKNVTEVSSWLYNNAKDKDGFVLISAASHDAIIFSSGLPMKKFIHEGTGKYWLSATSTPDHWARWIIMRTNDDNDQTFRLIKATPGLKYYTKVASYPFADIYELDATHLDTLITEPIIGKQK